MATNSPEKTVNCRYCRHWDWQAAILAGEHQLLPICAKRIALFPDHADRCRDYEREPGADDV